MLLISYLTYRIIHLIGVFLLLLGLGSLLAQPQAGSPLRRLGGLAHGVGLLIVLVAGFGLIARLGLDWPWPTWIYLKVVVWILVGALLMLARRQPEKSTLWWWAAFLLASIAAWLALAKPWG